MRWGWRKMNVYQPLLGQQILHVCPTEGGLTVIPVASPQSTTSHELSILFYPQWVSETSQAEDIA